MMTDAVDINMTEELEEPVTSREMVLAEDGGQEKEKKAISDVASNDSSGSDVLPARSAGTRRQNGRGVDAVAVAGSSASGGETRVSWSGAGDNRYRNGVLVEDGNDEVPTRRVAPRSRPSGSRGQRRADSEWFGLVRGRPQRRAAGPTRSVRRGDRATDQVEVMERRLTALVDTGHQRREHAASQRSRIEEIREMLERLPRPNRHGRGTHLSSWCPFNAKGVWRGTPPAPGYMGPARTWAREGRAFPAEDYPRPYIAGVREQVATMFSDELNTYAQFLSDYAVAVRRISLRLEQIGLKESFAWREEARQNAVERVSFRPTVSGRARKLQELQFHEKLRFGEATKYGGVLASALERIVERVACQPFSNLGGHGGLNDRAAEEVLVPAQPGKIS